MSKARARKSHIFEKEKRGHYVEPAWCSQRLFEVERFNGLIYDPACGWGTILVAANAIGYTAVGSDIVKRLRSPPPFAFYRHDFLGSHEQRLVNSPFSVVCNPPFDHVQEFCARALELGAEKVAMIMLVRRLNAAHWLEQLPLARVYLLSPRPSMPPGSWIAAGHKPGGGTQDFAWVLFERSYLGKPELQWLHRDG